MRASPARLLAAAIALGAFALSARATRAEIVPIVVVERADTDDDALASRVEGQLSDLDVALVREFGDVDDGAAGAQLDAARAIAERHAARAVVWFRRDGDGWLVHVADAESVIVRRVAATGDLAGSATAEAVALVVRASVRTIVSSPPEPVVIVAPPPPPPPAPVARARTPVRPFATLGWRGIVGSRDALHHTATARAGAARGAWRAAIDVGVAHGVVLADPSATIDVGRRSVAIAGAAEVTSAGPWRVEVEIVAGALRYDRTTIDTATGLRATDPSVAWAPLVAPGVRARRRLGAGASLDLALGGDVVGRSPEFGIPAADGFVVHTRLFPVQPFAAVAVTVEVP